jgi:hypothetical protein
MIIRVSYPDEVIKNIEDIINNPQRVKQLQQWVEDRKQGKNSVPQE